MPKDDGEPCPALVAAHLGDADHGLRLGYAVAADMAFGLFLVSFARAASWERGVADGVTAMAGGLSRRPGAAWLYLVESRRSADRSLWLVRDTERRRIVELLAARRAGTLTDGIRCEMLWSAIESTLHDRLVARGRLGSEAAVRTEVEKLVALF